MALSYPGHAGRPGKRGGSLPRGGVAGDLKPSNRRMDISMAASSLGRGFKTKAIDGRILNWDKSLVDKYMAKDPNRLRELAKAILATQKASHGVRERRGNQISYLHRVDHRSAVVVFADKLSGRVDHIGYISDKKANGKEVEKFLTTHTTRG